jgi:hypothetical protein
VRAALACTASLAVGCYAALPPPVDPAMLPACSAGSYGVLGTDACGHDDDCAVCALEELGSACDGEAPSADVACCERRCTLVASGGLF